MNKWEELAAPFPFSEIEVKAQSVSKEKSKALAAPYFDARAVRRRLNSVLGPSNWNCEIREGEKGIVCRLLVRIDDEWHYCEDGAGFTDFESFKGGISSAFKRAFAVRCNDSMYEIELGWFECELRQDGKFQKWTPASLKAIEKAYNNQTNAEQQKEPEKETELQAIKRCCREMNLTQTQFNEFKVKMTSENRKWLDIFFAAHKKGCNNYDRLIEYAESTREAA